MPYNMFAWTVSRILVVVLFTLLTSCSEYDANQAIAPDGQYVFSFQPDSFFTVSAFAKSNTPDQYKSDSMSCISWTVPDSHIKSLLEKGQSMNGSEWHHYYAHWPCSYTGKVFQNGDTLAVSINAGGWYAISKADSTAWYKILDNKLDQIFLSGRLEME